MGSKNTIYILGSGAIGFPLAAFLAKAGKDVIAVRTSRQDIPKSTITVTVQDGANRISTSVNTISLSRLTHLEGTIVIASKSFANQAIALELKDKEATGPVIIMQNGIGVEKPFLDAHFFPIYRCVLYVTSQTTSEYNFATRPVTSSPIGIVNGDETGLKKCINDLTTDGLPFHAETNIQREIWKKAILNAVFNSICPLLDVDNGIFFHNEEAAGLASEVVKECVGLTKEFNLGLTESEIMEQIMIISKRSDGQLISTLQDIRNGKQTEIEFLNLEIARVAASMQPALNLPRTELLGKMIVVKSSQARLAPV